MNNSAVPRGAERDIYKWKYGETRKLTAKNRHQWSRDMEFFLQAQDSMEIVLGMEEVPERNRESYAHYRKCQGKVAAMINAVCHLSVKGLLKESETQTNVGCPYR